MNQPFTPDQVNAIVRDMDDPRYPAQITVYCDRCGTEVTGDYMVHDGMTGPERLNVARAHLRTEGWSCTEDVDLCPDCAPRPAAAVTDRPYTDADLRAEAARQLYALTRDHDFMSIGEQMEGRTIDSRAEIDRASWDQLDDGDYETAEERVRALITGAADVSTWAVALGADGLEPDGTLTLGADDGGVDEPRIRIHLAFHPSIDSDDRDRFLTRLSQAIAAAL